LNTINHWTPAAALPDVPEHEKASFTMNQQPAARWSFEQLSNAFEQVFVDLTDDIIDGQAPALSDERMAEINMTWAEVLVSARWTFRQWSKALDREAQYAV
jgi:hypothetical protein